MPEVEEHPLSVLDAFSPQRSLALHLQIALDFVHKGAEMGARGTGGDHKQVGHDEELGNVQDGGVFALLLDDGGDGVPGGFDGLLVSCDVRSS